MKNDVCLSTGYAIIVIRTTIVYMRRSPFSPLETGWDIRSRKDRFSRNCRLRETQIHPHFPRCVFPEYFAELGTELIGEGALQGFFRFLFLSRWLLIWYISIAFCPHFRPLLTPSRFSFFVPVLFPFPVSLHFSPLERDSKGVWRTDAFATKIRKYLTNPVLFWRGNRATGAPSRVTRREAKKFHFQPN